jgi:hypothetical protein
MSRSTDVPHDEQDTRERVRYLLEFRWRGNQREMARAVGVSQGLISQVLNGHQAPGRKLLSALAAQPGISPEWVIKGTGQPLPFPERGSLPIALGVLPGPPLEYPHLLTGSRHPIADAFSRPTRYWLPVPSTSPLVADGRYQLRVGDLLLLEADVTWTRRPDLTNGRLCGVRVSDGPAFNYRLGRMVPVLERLVVDFGPDRELKAASPEPPSDPRVNRPHEASEPSASPPIRRRRTIRRLADEEHKVSEREQNSFAVEPEVTNVVPCQRDDVVAVCIYMARSEPVFAA